jgi:hypothetical protein
MRMRGPSPLRTYHAGYKYSSQTHDDRAPEPMIMCSLPEGWFSVKDPCFDAKGTGSVDDTVAIQACIDFVAARGGGTVYLPPGQYLVSAPGSRAYKLLLKSNVSIRGAGRSSLLVSALNQNMSARTLASDSASLLSCVTLADFAIDGRETANPHLPPIAPLAHAPAPASACRRWVSAGVAAASRPRDERPNRNAFTSLAAARRIVQARDYNLARGKK